MTNHQDEIARLSATYGVRTSDTFDGDIAAYHQIDRDLYTLEDLLAEGGKLTRIRLLTERGFPFMDISYVYGQLADGTEVRLYDGELDPKHMGLKRRTYRSQIAETIKAAGGTRAQAQQAWDSGNYAILWG